MKKIPFFIFFLSLGSLTPQGAVSQEGPESASPQIPVSQEMEQAIRMYHQGRDDEAMDRFMDILVKGDPNEKALANDYLNRLAHRMNVGEPTLRSPSLPQAVTPVPRPQAPAQAGSVDESRDLREKRLLLSRKHIEERLEGMRKDLIARLDGERAISLILSSEGLPVALGIRSREVFKGDVDFNLAVSGAVLPRLTGLLYVLGEAQVSIVPENFWVGESKILDMRRAVVLTSYFLQEGISPARVRTVLRKTDLEAPSALADFPGVVLLFAYHKPLVLEQRSEDQSPWISLGAYPRRFQAGGAEGAIIEFSVMTPSEGLAGWKFQLQRMLGGGEAAEPVLEAYDSKPIFHQIYWNGRMDFFGELLPVGRYLCVLRASDIRGRESVSKLALSVEPVKKIGEASSPASPAKLSGPPPAPAPVKKAVLKRSSRLRKKRLSRRARRRSLRGRRRKRAVPPQQPAASEAAAESGDAGASKTVKYRIGFLEGTSTITPEGEKILSQFANSMSLYPLAKFILVGYAYSGEPNANAMANRRAQIVSSILINQYRIDPQRMEVQTRLWGREASWVEAFLVGNKP